MPVNIQQTQFSFDIEQSTYLFLFDRHRNIGKDFPSASSFPKCLHYPRLSEAKARSSDFNTALPHEWQEFKHTEIRYRHPKKRLNCCTKYPTHTHTYTLNFLFEYFQSVIGRIHDAEPVEIEGGLTA